MNSITKVQENHLLRKIQNDLSSGYKVLGNHANQIDIIRVWCRKKGSEKIFGIVATSGMRFKNQGSFLELQSFGPGCNFKIAFLIIDEEIKETTISQTNLGTEYSIENFAEEFLNTIPDHDLTLLKMSAEGHNPKDVEWLK